uniref:Uncharacterized protein n=1 Tax=Anguilla anguilla TaxID=7936 RepID=A0A0E9SYE3_ANGAN
MVRNQHLSITAYLKCIVFKKGKDNISYIDIVYFYI